MICKYMYILNMKNVEYILYSMNKVVILMCLVDYDMNEWGFFLNVVLWELDKNWCIIRRKLKSIRKMFFEKIFF